MLRRGCILDTLPSGSKGALAAARGDGDAAAAARSSPPLTQAGAALALRSRVVETAAVLLGGGEGITLVGEQFIAKPPRSAPSSAFALHADADALPGGRHSPDARAYVSIWVPLDACDGGSGGLVVAGVPLTLPAGVGVAMRGDALHESPGNGSGRWRRAWMPQYCRGGGLGAGWRVRVLSVRFGFQRRLCERRKTSALSHFFFELVPGAEATRCLSLPPPPPQRSPDLTRASL